MQPTTLSKIRIRQSVVLPIAVRKTVRTCWAFAKKHAEEAPMWSSIERHLERARFSLRKVSHPPLANCQFTQEVIGAFQDVAFLILEKIRNINESSRSEYIAADAEINRLVAFVGEAMRAAKKIAGYAIQVREFDPLYCTAVQTLAGKFEFLSTTLSAASEIGHDCAITLRSRAECSVSTKLAQPRIAQYTDIIGLQCISSMAFSRRY